MINTIKVMFISEKARLPEYAHYGDAGLDIFSIERVIINPGESRLIRTGIVIELPQGTEAEIRPRSGLALNNQITVLNSPGTIDSNYRGEIGVILINHGRRPFFVEEGMKIAQMVVKPVLYVNVEKADKITNTSRGENGFGSTG